MASRSLRALAAAVLCFTAAAADDNTLYQSDFPPAELAARRAKVFDQIGKAAHALVQGAPKIKGFGSFSWIDVFANSYVEFFFVFTWKRF